ncbi:hypothetical protein H105_03213 [Trichophyton soudanense CBS 452.61]|uniref:Uncharacterized protein n=1 Tax=Trichophyton soudanense CBS 452.61 TaxID=1215331 RepID=A0A022XWV9_TRISD|nr:hypothetical protein H105_03213 [Trichophyton soudanense CBS 452.61]EZG07773.1 hypothetical protein H106_03040 [Trichophyton rubrum CBS 735.88]
MVSQVCDPAVDIINRDNIGPDELGFQAPSDPRYIEKDLQAMKVAGHTLPSLVKNASLQGIFRPRPTTSYLVLQPNKSRTCSFQSLILLSGHFVGAPRIAFSVDQLCRGRGASWIAFPARYSACTYISILPAGCPAIASL